MSRNQRTSKNQTQRNTSLLRFAKDYGHKTPVFPSGRPIIPKQKPSQKLSELTELGRFLPSAFQVTASSRRSMGGGCTSGAALRSVLVLTLLLWLFCFGLFFLFWYVLVSCFCLPSSFGGAARKNMPSAAVLGSLYTTTSDPAKLHRR